MLRPGNVYRLVGAAGGCLQYLGRHSFYGETILVAREGRNASFSAGLHLPEDGYVTFFPVRAAFKAGLLEFVVRCAPVVGPPSVTRLQGAIDEQGRTSTWLIRGDDGTRVVCELSAEESRLPIGEVLDYEALLHFVRTGWTPESDL